MAAKLDAYLDEIGRYLPDADREEILAEIRSHILESAAGGPERASEAAVEAAIATYGTPRRVAARYLDDRPIIAPVYRRHLVRYTAILFAIHAVLTVVAVAFGRSFAIFPFFYVPRLNALESIFYLPMALLADLGLVAFILHLVTRSGKEVRLPWPRFGAGAESAGASRKRAESWLSLFLGIAISGALTGLVAYVYLRNGTIFFRSLDPARPLFTPEAGRFYSLAVVALFAIGFGEQLAKLVRPSAWVSLGLNVLSLVILGLVLSRPIEGAAAAGLERLEPLLEVIVTAVAGIGAVAAAVGVVKSLIAIVRRRLRAGNRRSPDAAAR